MEVLGYYLDGIALVASVYAVFYAVRAERRIVRERERTDRLYQKTATRISDHIESNLH